MATKKNDKPLKLSLASGEHVPEGFKGVDIVKTKAATYVQDLLSFPWKQFADNSVDEIECSNFVEHIPHGDSRHDPFFAFFDEVYRILKPAEFDPSNPNIPLKGFARITCPYYSSMRAWQDPTHQRAISEASFLYLNKQWRIDNKLDHYPITCDFDFSYGYLLMPEWQNRSQEAQTFAIQHYLNVVSDIQVQIVKRSASK
ncbi:MAG TPA: class I SAM-dependent methyltransferase [Candidatus Saccharimonas sp.]|nr:class I SAM-dependent methyltransferase [Candidatus Saccharimonas sp.]